MIISARDYAGGLRTSAMVADMVAERFPDAELETLPWSKGRVFVSAAAGQCANGVICAHAGDESFIIPYCEWTECDYTARVYARIRFSYPFSCLVLDRLKKQSPDAYAALVKAASEP